MTGRWERLAPLTGAVFVALLVASFIVSGDTPDADASVRKVVDFYKDHDTKQVVSGILGAYGVVFFMFFNGRLRRVLRTAEDPGAGGLSTTAFAGGIVFAVGGAIFSALTFTLGDTAGDISPAATQTLHVMNSEFFFPVAAGLATLLIATGGATIRTGALPRWLGWVALVLGVLTLTPVGFFAFLASLLWVLATSVLLALRTGKAEAGPATPD